MIKPKYIILSIIVIASVVIGYFYIANAPLRDNQSKLAGISVPEGLSPNGQELCENIRLAYEEFFEYLFRNEDSRNLPPLKFFKKYNEKHAAYLKTPFTQLIRRNDITDEKEIRKILDYSEKCSNVHFDCLGLYFKEMNLK